MSLGMQYLLLKTLEHPTMKQEESHLFRIGIKVQLSFLLNIQIILWERALNRTLTTLKPIGDEKKYV
jgi:hypothetical protein